MYKPLSELVVRSHGGGTPSRSIAKYWNGNIPWATVKDFRDDKTELADTEEHITPEGLRASSAQLVPTQIPIACMRMAVGRVAIFDQEVAINQDLRALYPAACINTRYFLKQLAFSLSSLQGFTTGTTVKGLSTTDLLSLSIYVPEDFEEQCSIATVLDIADESIAKTQALVAKLEAIKQGLRHDLLYRGLHEDGRMRDPVVQPHDFVESPWGLVPKSWQIRPLGEVLEEIGGRLQTGPFGSQLHAHEYQLHGVPVIMPQDIQDGRIQLEKIARVTEVKAKSMARHRLSYGDIIFARRGDLIRAAATSDREKGWLCGTGCFLLRLPQGLVNARWLAEIYRFFYVQRQVEARAVGSTMLSLNNAVMDTLLIAWPQKEEQDEIMSRLDAWDQHIQVEAAYLTKLRLLKKGLMQDLLTGRVRVPPEKITALAMG